MCYTLEKREINTNAVRRLYSAARATKKERNIKAADCLLDSVLSKQEVSAGKPARKLQPELV